MKPIYLLFFGLYFLTSCVELNIAIPLYYPAEGAILDNGRLDNQDSVVWDFRWPATNGASKYNLYVFNHAALNPVIDEVVTTTSYCHAKWGGYIVDRNRFGWSWKVRAMVNGKWQAWSKEFNFTIEPANTD